MAHLRLRRLVGCIAVSLGQILLVLGLLLVLLARLLFRQGCPARRTHEIGLLLMFCSHLAVLGGLLLVLFGVLAILFAGGRAETRLGITLGRRNQS